MKAIGGPDRTQGLVLMVGVAVLGLAVVLSFFIGYQLRDPGPPEDIPRAIAIPALYATMGLLAIIGGLQRRPASVIAAGVLCLAGTILSIATIEFALPGILLILFGSRLQGRPARRRPEALIAAATVLLVVSAAVALLAMTEARCWQATGSPANPTYALLPCTSQAGLVAGGQTFASGFDSGELTIGGGLVEAVLLLAALALTGTTGRTRPGGSVLPSIDQEPPA